MNAMYDNEYPGSEAPAPTYQFTPRETSVIAGLRTSVRIVSIGWFVLALLLAAMGALLVVKGASAMSGILAVPFLFGAAIMFFMGKSLFGAANSLGAISRSDGNDIPKLVGAVEKIGDYFKIILVFVIIVFVLAVLIGILST
jgi:hypothetical protein